MKSNVAHYHLPAPETAILSKRYVERYQFDAEYLRLLIERDPETERHFVAYFGDLLSVKLRSRLRHADLVEDARQETLLRVLRALRTQGISTPQALGAYVNSVCNNVLFEMYRAESKSPTLTEELPDLASHEESIESKLMNAELRAKVRLVLTELPAKDQEILRQCFFEQKDKDEICRQFRVDREYLRVLLHRAKIRFRACFVKGQGA